jgi:hypothetical protein
LLLRLLSKDLVALLFESRFKQEAIRARKIKILITKEGVGLQGRGASNVLHLKPYIVCV